MSFFFPRGALSVSVAGGRTSGLGSSLLVHALIFGLAILGLGSARKIVDAAPPIAVRLLSEVPKEEARVQPEPPRRQPPVRRPHVDRPLPVMSSQVPVAQSSFTVAEQPAQTPAPEAPPAPPAPAVESLVEARFDADYLSNPKPPYPSASRRLGETGTVYLRVNVSEEGHALKVELKKSCGFERLDHSAMETVAQWRFVPARRGKTPVMSWVVVPVVFSLS